MKISPIVFVLPFAWVCGTLAHAVERIPIQTVLCYPATHIVNWSYLASGNTFNGALDHEGYIYINFNRYRQANGRILQTNLTHPIEELRWDAGFKRITATPAAGVNPITCATVGHFGSVHKDERNCELEGRFIPNGPMPEECGDEPSYLFDGELIIR